MGTVRKHEKTGKLFVDFRVNNQRCREYTALADTVANRKRLEKLLKVIETDMAAGIFDYRRFFPNSKAAEKFSSLAAAEDGSSSVIQTLNTLDESAVDRPLARTAAPTPPFKEFAETWYSEKEIEWRRSHKALVRDDLDKLLIPHFGEMRVGQIAKSEVLAFRAQLAKVTARNRTNPMSNARINKIMNPLRQILNEAADRFDFRTPFASIKQLKVAKTDVHPFTMNEVKALLNAIRPDFHNYLITRFFTGMRTGEVNGLQWKYVNFERRLILVRETVVFGEDEYTKTDSSQRDIQMSQAVFDALSDQHKSTGKYKYVFCNRAGDPLDNRNFVNRVWNPLLRRLKLEKRRPYECRHTAATLWLAAGESPEWIARQLGHGTTEMLFRVYSRFVPNLTRQDGSAFERLLMQSGAVTGGHRSGTAANDDAPEAAMQQEVSDLSNAPARKIN